MVIVLLLDFLTLLWTGYMLGLQESTYFTPIFKTQTNCTKVLKAEKCRYAKFFEITAKKKYQITSKIDISRLTKRKLKLSNNKFFLVGRFVKVFIISKSLTVTARMQSSFSWWNLNQQWTNNCKGGCSLVEILVAGLRIYLKKALSQEFFRDFDKILWRTILQFY